MYEWIDKKPTRFLGIAWFVSYILGWLTVMLVDLILGAFFNLDSTNVSPSFVISLLLFGFTIAGLLSGLATASLVRVHEGEISQASFNLIVLAWTITVTLAAMLFFLVTTVLVQTSGAG